MAALTPHDIVCFLIPCVIDVLAYPTIVLSVRRILRSGPSFIASAVTGRRSFAEADMRSAARLWACTAIVTILVDATRPPTWQWLSTPLISGWDRTWGIAMILMSAAWPLTHLLAPLLALMLTLALLGTPWVRQAIRDAALWLVRNTTPRRRALRPKPAPPHSFI